MNRLLGVELGEVRWLTPVVPRPLIEFLVAEHFAQRLTYMRKIVLTDDTNLAAMYAATVYPIYVAIDREGNIGATQRGAGGEEALRELLATAGLEIKTESDTDPASAAP